MAFVVVVAATSIVGSAGDAPPMFVIEIGSDSV
jgi:hypothetical protein